ncbi:hypothetical protein Tco_0041679, partial [Tanacetum coccineum]
ESLPSVSDAYEYPTTIAMSGVPGDGSRMHTHNHDGSEAPDESPNSILSSEPKPLGKHSIYCADKPIIYPSTSGGCSNSEISSLRSTCGGMYSDGGSGGDDDGSSGDGIGSGDECAGGAVHLARRSPAEGGDSEIGGDGDGVVMTRSLSTSASGGRDMEV